MAKITREYLIQPDDPRLKRPIVGTPLGKRPAVSEKERHARLRARLMDQYPGLTDEQYEELEYLL